MLIKKSKILVKFGLLLKRLKDSDYIDFCDFCIFKNKKNCKLNGFDCVDYDSFSYSFIVNKVYKKKKPRD